MLQPARVICRGYHEHGARVGSSTEIGARSQSAAVAGLCLVCQDQDGALESPAQAKNVHQWLSIPARLSDDDCFNGGRPQDGGATWRMPDGVTAGERPEGKDDPLIRRSETPVTFAPRAERTRVRGPVWRSMTPLAFRMQDRGAGWSSDRPAKTARDARFFTGQCQSRPNDYWAGRCLAGAATWVEKVRFRSSASVLREVGRQYAMGMRTKNIGRKTINGIGRLAPIDRLIAAHVEET